ncbi:MAG: hypothetical protein C4521_11020 [Actinobacteria bacterium]|nr:MAG: hypothetical protein C4521_11020 [Actinomycetota bacterium]
MNAYYLDAIPVELLRREQDRITAEVSSVEGELAKASVSLEQATETVRMAMTMAANCHMAYVKASPQTRRLINQAFFERILVRSDKISDYKHTDLFELLYDYDNISNNELLAEREGFEPSKGL